MHYDRRSFSKNGRDTMVAKEAGEKFASPVDFNFRVWPGAGMTSVIGRVKNFSPADLRKINKVYDCPRSGGPSLPVQPAPTQVNPNIPHAPSSGSWVTRAGT